MKISKHKKTLILLPLLILIDIITKLAIKNQCLDCPVQITNFFSIDYKENTGTVFGLFQGSNLAFILMTIAVIILILWFYKKEKLLRISLTLILGGAIGNLIDRIAYGYVIDFINFKFWPTFNFADVFIVIGIIICIFSMLKIHKK